MNNEINNAAASHVLLIDGERFPIFHKERRLYGFVDWKDSRNRLIKVMIERIKAETGESTAFINFKAVNPMRKTRLGNFFIDVDAEIMVNGVSLGTPEELGLHKIFSDTFVTLDSEEMKQRAETELRHSSSQYEQELSTRTRSLSDTYPNKTGDEVKNLAIDLMEKDGWHTTFDNRIHARVKRLNSLHTI